MSEGTGRTGRRTSSSCAAGGPNTSGRCAAGRRSGDPRPTRSPAVDRRLRILFVVSAIDVLGFGILIPLVPYMANRFGARPELITAILGSYSLCQFVAAP